MAQSNKNITQIPMPQRIAWARAEWESGVKMTTVSKKHGVSRATLYRRKEDDGWTRSDATKGEALYERAKEVIKSRELEAMEELEAHLGTVVSRQRLLADELHVMVKEAFTRVEAEIQPEAFKYAMSVKICSELLRNLVNENSKIYGLISPKSTRGTAAKPVKLSELLDELDSD
tara:strand:+ start:419 stop:940 length:522 start_codon:yes stop_codon:yes gene_type:complete